MAGKAKVDFFGSSELLKKIENAGKNVEQACAQALVKSVQKPKQEMLDFIQAHHLSGQTEKSFDEELIIENGKIICRIGFNASKGGLPAIFLNLGTPKTQPYFFIDKAVEENIDEIKRIQLDVLRSFLE